ncbi:hypothetical protein RHS04_04906 [Rhizoctonia solani]|uniref:Uncharacterized protein n=1 Tax=Rhizoctonia solani TaxID=456999 RepID=A0A8H7LJU2_9AGAM|nr:hypothetical protein RHS04_04906 [Rhizoctonia solani]
MVWPPAPVSIRYTPPAVRVHYAPIDLREPRNSLPGSSKNSTGFPGLGELINRLINLISRNRPTKTSNLSAAPPTKIITIAYPANPAPASRTHKTKATCTFSTSVLDPLVSIGSYMLATSWIVLTLASSIFVFMRYTRTAAPSSSFIPTSELDVAPPCRVPWDHLTSRSYTSSPTPENIPLPAVTKDELIALDTTLHGSAPVGAALALSTGIDAKNRVEGTTDMNGASIGGKTLEPALLVDCIDASLLCEYYETYRPPNLAKYPPEDRMRVRGREVRLAAKLQDKRRRQDAKEGKNEPKPSMRADFEVWMEMMKHGCIPGDKERPENWSLRSIARWKTRDGGRNERAAKVKWADEV